MQPPQQTMKPINPTRNSSIPRYQPFKPSIRHDEYRTLSLQSTNKQLSQPSIHHRHHHTSKLIISSSASRPQINAAAATTIPDNSVSLVLLAGGVGKRMGASIPKQYLNLCGKPIATYSMTTFASMPQIGEIIVVCEPEWRDIFTACYSHLPRQPPLKFALPGAERQDSVYNGLQQIAEAAHLVAVHDSARPLITARDALVCFEDAQRVGAAVLGVPVKPTIKEVDGSNKVVKTLKRSVLWEVQTPQVIQPPLLRRGFALVAEQGLEVTDDVSIVEALGEPVLITPGSYTNIKVTTPDDMSVAERFLEEEQKSSTIKVGA